MTALRKYLFTGLLLWLPLGITLWILGALIGWMDQTLLLVPEALHPKALLGFNIPGLGVLLTLAVVLLTGMLATNIVGRRLANWGDRLMRRIPVVRFIYSSVKQVSDTLLKNSGRSFRKVVLVEFPQPGQWTLGFLVGEPQGAVAETLGEGFVTVYVATAPNPTSGYVLMTHMSRIHAVDVSVDDALKFHVSLGVIGPGARARGAHASALTTPEARSAPPH
ncbi:MAG TPA: DUF502 domain-containing protein [Burkholderiaceae bacterium]|nr:DUF502 domain-containing protein [Burkholderiaceae bacterium]